jgi:ribosome recycling factor
VLKSLQASEFELSVQIDGKDIRVKLGTSRKEHIEAAKKKIRAVSDEFKKNLRDARHKALEVVKKLGKILPQDEISQLEDEINDKVKKAEDQAKQTIDAKEKEVGQ